MGRLAVNFFEYEAGMTSNQHYGAIVIGSGQGGTPLSHALANAGIHTALVEKKQVGGTCINEGCTPTKTMIASGRVAYLARRSAGCRPAVPPLEGLQDVPFLDSTSIMELGEVPDHLIVLGGGYVGLEFGQLFRRLGSRVTIVQSAARLLGHEDKDIAEAVADIL